MGSSIGALLDMSRRALSVQSGVVQVIGNNIANVNTEGYSRRQAELVSVSGGDTASSDAFGAGTRVNEIVRVSDQFINGQLLERVSEASRTDIRNEFLSRAESIMSLENTDSDIGARLAEFHSALDDLASNPSDGTLRNLVITSGTRLTDSIKDTFNHFGSLQREADSRLVQQVERVNQLTTQIASLNEDISGGGETGAQQNLSLRDERDQLMRQLSEYVGFNQVELSNGAMLITLDGGFPLVNNNTSRDLTYTPSPGFLPAGPFPTGLDGLPLGFITYQYSSTSEADLTSAIAQSGGEMGGILNVRGVQTLTDPDSFAAVGDLPNFASRIEAITRHLLVRYNNQYRGPQEDDSSPVRLPTAVDLYGNNPGVFGLFDSATTTLADVDGNGEVTMGTDIVRTTNYSANLQFAISDPSVIAAGRDILDDPNPVNGETGIVEGAPGDARNLIGDPSYSPRGGPPNAEDIIGQRGLIDMQYETVTYSAFQVGAFTENATIGELYNLTVGYVGGVTGRAGSDARLESDRKLAMEQIQANVSGVSLDEEFAKLINFQRAFEASARMIRIGDELLREILSVAG